MPLSLTELLPDLMALCREAGAAICHHYHAPGADRYQAKGDDSPLTLADLASHAILDPGLARLGSGLPVLSEESDPHDPAVRRAWQRYWLVDPLDGTKEFLARTGEFTINIALIDDHRPVMGVLYQPLQELAYTGIPGQGAWRSDPGARHWDVQPLHAQPLREGRGLRVLASRRHRSRRLGACLDWLEARWQPLERHNSGSALKFCQLVEGEGDLYPRFARCCEWDTAAGQALLEGAGGALLGMDGEPLRYNTSDSLYSPNFYGIADPDHALWRDLLAQGGFATAQE